MGPCYIVQQDWGAIVRGCHTLARVMIGACSSIKERIFPLVAITDQSSDIYRHQRKPRTMALISIKAATVDYRKQRDTYSANANQLSSPVLLVTTLIGGALINQGFNYLYNRYYKSPSKQTQEKHEIKHQVLIWNGVSYTAR